MPELFFRTTKNTVSRLLRSRSQVQILLRFLEPTELDNKVYPTKLLMRIYKINTMKM